MNDRQFNGFSTTLECCGVPLPVVMVPVDGIASSVNQYQIDSMGYERLEESEINYAPFYCDVDDAIYWAIQYPSMLIFSSVWKDVAWVYDGCRLRLHVGAQPAFSYGIAYTHDLIISPLVQHTSRLSDAEHVALLGMLRDIIDTEE